MFTTVDIARGRNLPMDSSNEATAKVATPTPQNLRMKVILTSIVFVLVAASMIAYVLYKDNLFYAFIIGAALVAISQDIWVARKPK